MKFSKNAKRAFVSSIAVSLLLSVTTVNSMPAAMAKTRAPYGAAGVADDTLIVTLAQHADRASLKASLKNEAHANTLNDLHSEVRDYSVFQVKGPEGKRESTLASIKSMMSAHPEIKAVERNYVRHYQLGSHGGGGGINGVPNDPDFATQWPLAHENWIAARAAFGNLQGTRPATITILSQGTNPVYNNGELGTWIKQYNAINPNITPFPVPVSGLPSNACNCFLGAEGDLDSSTPGALTSNGVDMAGAACFVSSNPCRITMLQFTNSGFVSDAQIANALIFRINNQKHLGGAGPVNLSFGSGTPVAIAGPGDPPLWGAAYIQEAGADLQLENSILVLAAGDNFSDGFASPAGDYQIQVFNPPADPAPGNVTVVQASANNANNGALLTEVVNDPVFAPGDLQPAIIDGQFLPADFFGSSFSAPQWCSAVAMLMSINPSLSAQAASNLLVTTGTTASGNGPNPLAPFGPPFTTPAPSPTWHFVIPNFFKAIQAAH